MATYDDTAGETASPTDAASAQVASPFTLADIVRWRDSPAPNEIYGLGLSEGVLWRETQIPTAQAIEALSDTTTLTATNAFLFQAGAVIKDVVKWQETLLPAVYYGALLADTALLTEKLLTGLPAVISDVLTLTEATTMALGLTVVHQLYLADTNAPTANFGLGLLDAMKLGDLLANFFGGELSDTVGFTSEALPLYRASSILSDTLSLSSVLGPQFVVSVIAKDSFNLDAVDALQSLFSGDIAEELQFGVAFIQPDGTDPSITTWAINTRTLAVTEYVNYQFDSFTQSGHKYLAGNASGLYELQGATDDGINVLAHIKTGIVQVGGSRLAGFKAAYIGMRTGGDYVLRLETGDGRRYDYGVKTQNMLTTKVNLGKGLRARYFSFELIGSGADMELDTIEFVPIYNQRRV